MNLTLHFHLGTKTDGDGLGTIEIAGDGGGVGLSFLEVVEGLNGLLELRIPNLFNFSFFTKHMESFLSISSSRRMISAPVIT